MLRPVLIAVLLASSAHAQRTYIVDWFMRAGAHYRDIPAAVAAAKHGDIISCRSGRYTPPNTNKGVTVLGNGAQLGTGLVVKGLPAGKTFRFIGFHIIGGELFKATIENCAGAVHIEDVHAREHGSHGWNDAMTIRSSAFVTLQNVETFGSPAVFVDKSTVVMNECRFGVVSSNLGGGQPVVMKDSKVSVGEPWFDGSQSKLPAIDVSGGKLVLSGHGPSRVQGGTIGTAQPAIRLTNAVLDYDPAIRLNPNSKATAIVTNGTVNKLTIPTLLVKEMRPGANMIISAFSQPSDLFFLAVGPPATPSIHGPGDLWLTRGAFLLARGSCSTTGYWATAVSIPASLPSGLPVMLQGYAEGRGRGFSTPTVVVGR